MATNAALLLQISANDEAFRKGVSTASDAFEVFVRDADTQLGAVEKRFDNFRTNGITASLKQAEKQFNDSFTAIQKMATNALSAPRTGAGSLDIGAAGLRASQAAAENQATAYREIVAAAEKAAQATGDLSNETRLYIQAGRALIVAADGEARSFAVQAAAAERLQDELSATRSATISTSGAIVAHTGHMGGASASTMIFQHVLRSTTDSIAAGLPVTMIMGEQIGRLGEAAALSGGSMGKFGEFLMGPWGIALIAASSVAGVLANHLIEGAEAAKTDATAKDLLKEAVDRLAGAQASLDHATKQGIIDDMNAAAAARQHEIAVRGVLAAKLQSAQADLKASKASAAAGGLDAGSAAGLGMRMSGADAASRDLDKQLSDNQHAINDANKAILTGATKLIQRGIEGKTDPRSAANQSFQDQADALDRQFQSGKLSPDAYRAKYTAITNIRDSTLNSLSARDRTPRADHSGEKALTADISFTEEEMKLKKAFLDAAAKTTSNADARDELAKQEIEAERQATARELQDRYGKGAFGKVGSDQAKAELATLQGLNDQAAAQKAGNVDIERRSQMVQQSFAAQKDGLDADIKFAQLQLDLAKTTQQRRDLAVKILALEQQRAGLNPAEVLADPKSSPEDIAKAKADQAAQAKAAPLELRKAQQDNLGPGAAFVKSLNNQDLNEQIQSVKVDAIQGLGNDLESAATSALKLHGVLGTIANDLIRIAIQREIEMPIANALFPATGSAASAGSGGGLFGSLFGGIGKLFGGGGPKLGYDLLGFASGGSGTIGGNGGTDQNVMSINGSPVARVSKGEKFAIIPASVPSPKQIGESRAAGVSPVFHLDLRGAVMTQDLLDQMNSIGKVAAVQGASGGAHMAASNAARAQRRSLRG